MKKIFAICAMVLVAGALLTSCKDKPKDNTLTVKLGENTEWTANDVYADVTPADHMILSASEKYSDDNVAYVKGSLGKDAGTFKMADGYFFVYVEDINDHDSTGAANWYATAATQELTNVDLNAKTIDGTANQTMANTKTGATDVAMDVTMTNVAWTARDLAKKAINVK